MVIDSHCHIFNERIVENMLTRPALVKQLHLNVQGARPLLSPRALQEVAEANGIEACVMLPSTGPNRVRSENDRFVQWTREFPRLRTFATLHPLMDDLPGEISRMFDLGVAGFKFSSFSQRFDIASPEARRMWHGIERLSAERSKRATLVFDTFVTAHDHFGSVPEHLTTPSRLAHIVHQHEGINIIAAHMGGLLADFDDILRALPPSPHLYLDTSNAAHTLNESQFVELLSVHGASHILFGTDWPWFDHESEMALLKVLMEKAGYDRVEQARVFGENARELLGL
jgi:predicted TIM-barrel fold metal-dependent hydrolase